MQSPTNSTPIWSGEVVPVVPRQQVTQQSKLKNLDDIQPKYDPMHDLNSPYDEVLVEINYR